VGPVPDVPEPTDAEIAFLLDVMSGVLDRPLGRPDVVGAYAGLRPLLESGGRTADLSRRHAVITSEGGLITVAGGKLTTYRRMAQDAVDAAARLRGLPAGVCRTAHLPLVGAGSPRALRATPAPTRLVRRYGLEAGRLTEQPNDSAALVEGLPTTMAELCFGVTHEGALDVDDLLDRRTRVGLVPGDRAALEPYARQALAAALR
jgi:glycerol-3-phosphate dehydrogenase